ncbi:hypothetical protein EG359_17335 [Chryseobacterium joostei]|uniref:Uncharacterized protein n=1 Tax=Chryseobacterium joostei TaxID=112234 RepID=A0A1N7IB27_9FLAO|nr:hypothetical protein [Chryseobacterium joostei]AZB01267.1 hypothetical protein EG359_17335 [Chryseobacterium joostei]SIS34253.1 hypothetical protein SAMN05421768_103666 [Chryseobacterium joostei]
MNQLTELTADIREKLPRLTTVQEYMMNDGSKMKFGEDYPVVITDIMEYLGIKSVEFAFTHNGFYAYDDELEVWGDFIPIELHSPFLKDQSPELITFLHGLIKNY